MSEQLEFVLRMKDMFSGMLPKIANVSASTFGGVNSNINQTQMNLNRLSGPVKINVDSSGLKQAQTDIAGVNERMGMLGTSAAMAIGTGIERVVERGISFARDQMSDVFNQGMQGSALKVQYNVMAGKEEGTKLYGDLTKYIQDSIFGNELYGDAKVLLSYGDAAKNVMPDIKMLGDIAMGDAEKMKGLTVAFGQVMSTGHLMGQDLNQMIQGGGFNPLMVIAEKTHGKNSIEARYQELKDLGEQGKISFGMIRSAFETATGEGGKFYHMLDEIAKTPFGKKAAMEGNIENAKLTLGTALLPSVTYFMDTMQPVINDLPGQLLKMQPAISGAVHEFADMFKWASANTTLLGELFSVVKIGTEIFIGYKIAMFGAGVAVNIYSKATEAATVANKLFGISEMTAAGAVAKNGIAVNVAAADYAYYTSSTVAATVATEELTTVMALTPWGIIAAGIGAVAAAYLLLKDNREKNLSVKDDFAQYNRGRNMQTEDGFKNPLAGGHFMQDSSTYSLVKVISGINDTIGHMDTVFTGKKIWVPAAIADTIDKNPAITALLKNSVPMGAVAANAKGSKETASAIEDQTSAITGGGKKVININFKSFVEHLHNNVTSKADGQAWTENELKEMLARVLAGVPK